MATSKHAWNVVRRALENGGKLPTQTYKDKYGKFTQDPYKAFSVIPFGDYKGFALGILVEILCGGLFNMKMVKTKKSEIPSKTLRGAIFIAVNPVWFGSVSKFKSSVTKLLQEIKSSKYNPGIKNIHIPGQSTLEI